MRIKSAAIRSLKQYVAWLQCYEALVKYVEQSVNDYNNRPQHVLYGLTPFEVLQGQTPNPHAYATQILQAKTNRLTENKKIKCCYHSF
jgi:hypothetical protein